MTGDEKKLSYHEDRERRHRIYPACLVRFFLGALTFFLDMMRLSISTVFFDISGIRPAGGKIVQGRTIGCALTLPSHSRLRPRKSAQNQAQSASRTRCILLVHVPFSFLSSGVCVVFNLCAFHLHI